MSYTVRDSAKAFKDAIEAGFLSDNPHTLRNDYAGDYMYMETINNVDTFKHIETRRTIFRLKGDPIAAVDA